MNIAGRVVPRSRVLVVACACELAALALMSWQLFDPRPAQVIVAMSVGQILGTASFLAFLHVVWRDLRAARRAAREAVDRSTAE
jgi:hypothetical protein